MQKLGLAVQTKKGVCALLESEYPFGICDILKLVLFVTRLLDHLIGKEKIQDSCAQRIKHTDS